MRASNANGQVTMFAAGCFLRIIGSNNAAPPHDCGRLEPSGAPECEFWPPVMAVRTIHLEDCNDAAPFVKLGVGGFHSRRRGPGESWQFMHDGMRTSGGFDAQPIAIGPRFDSCRLGLHKQFIACVARW
jgi:hypothetical protein